MTGLSWNRRHPDRIRLAHRKFEKSAKRRRYLNGRGVLARKMSDKLRFEIVMGRFPKATACAFKDFTCYGAVQYAHTCYCSWEKVISLCRSHHSRFDKKLPKTTHLSSDEKKRAKAA